MINTIVVSKSLVYYKICQMFFQSQTDIKCDIMISRKNCDGNQHFAFIDLKDEPDDAIISLSDKFDEFLRYIFFT